MLSQYPETKKSADRKRANREGRDLNRIRLLLSPYSVVQRAHSTLARACLISNVGKTMTLKPNYLRGFVTTVLWVWGLILIFSGGVPYLQGRHVDWSGIFASAVIGGAFLGVGVCVMFTPREIKWNEEGISLRVVFPKSGDYTWRQLEAYSTWGSRFSTFLLKLEGMQSYQIVPVCFRSEEWKAFQSFLRTRFPEKKTWFWFGPMPVRFGKK